WSVLLAGLVVVGVGGPLRAEKAGEHAAHQGISKYNVLIHPAGADEEERKFDLSQEKEVQELTALRRNGEVLEVQQAKEVNILDISWDLGLWTVVVFVVLLLVLKKLAWKPLMEGLSRREQYYHQALEEAQKARSEAQTLRAELQQQMDRAQETVREIHEEARRSAQHMQDEMLAKAPPQIQAEQDPLPPEIQTAH